MELYKDLGYYFYMFFGAEAKEAHVLLVSGREVIEKVVVLVFIPTVKVCTMIFRTPCI